MDWELLHTWSLAFFGTKWPLRVAAVLVIVPPLLAGLVLHGHMRLSEAVSGLAAACLLAGLRAALHEQNTYPTFPASAPAARLLHFYLIERPFLKLKGRLRPRVMERFVESAT